MNINMLTHNNINLDHENNIIREYIEIHNMVNFRNISDTIILTILSVISFILTL